MKIVSLIDRLFDLVSNRMNDPSFLNVSLELLSSILISSFPKLSQDLQLETLKSIESNDVLRVELSLAILSLFHRLVELTSKNQGQLDDV